jgi:hypothetical protein
MNATINNLTVNGLLNQSRMYVRYDNVGGQNSSGNPTTLLQFSTATTSVNATGLTVSGAGNTTFTNTSGNAQYWIIGATLAPSNTDTVTQKLGLKLYINGTSLDGISFYVPAGYSNSMTATTPLLMNNNDALTVEFVQTGTAVMTLGVATLFIMQV